MINEISRKNAIRMLMVTNAVQRGKKVVNVSARCDGEKREKRQKQTETDKEWGGGKSTKRRYPRSRGVTVLDLAEIGKEDVGDGDDGGSSGRQ